MAKDDNSTILEGVGWKRRSGFGKFRSDIGVGSSWERRRFTLTANEVKYYDADNKPNKARGTLEIIPERATITATYPADASQPTPYALTLKIGDHSEKWKFCFEDRETQLLWLVALTDLVATASVREYNAQVLKEGKGGMLDKGTGTSTNGGKGFHRLYEEGGGRLLDLVHNALMVGGGTGTAPRRQAQKRAEGEAIQVVPKSVRGTDDGGASQCGAGDSVRMVQSSDSTVAWAETASTAKYPRKGAAQSKEASVDAGDDRRVHKLPDAKLYQCLAVLATSFVVEKVAGFSSAPSSLLWQLASALVLCICFYPAASEGKKGERAAEAPPPGTRKAANATAEITSAAPSNGKDAHGTAERASAPLDPAPSFVDPKPGAGADADGASQVPTPRREALTDDEMDAHRDQRWAVSAPTVDLSGQWTLIADAAFKTEYDAYLKQLGFGGITRKVACGVIGRTAETTRQTDHGRELYLKGTNPKGAWERTLTASGYPDGAPPPAGGEYAHTRTTIKTADAEDVLAEAWWEDRGTKHRSWLRGGKKYGGGDFESLRYLEEGSDGKVLVCESFFCPNDASKKKATVTWRFTRDE